MQPAFVLHRWPYQDTSLLVELFSPEFGRFRVIAKGAKRAKNPWRSILQPFIPLLVESRGRHELQTLTSAEATGMAIPLQGTSLYSGFYLNELMQRLTSPYQVVEGLFDEYQQSLKLLAEVEQIEPILRRFEWQLLVLLGHGFDWHQDYEGQPIELASRYEFFPDAGFRMASANSQQSMLGADIQKMAAFELQDQRLLNLFKRVMRRALQPYLGEQPLRSRELFTQFKETK